MVDPLPSAERELSRRRPIYRDFNVLQLVALVFLLDQLTKYVVIETLSQGMSYPFRGFFRFTHVYNTGSAFGILQGLNTPLIFVSFIGVIILALIYQNQARPSNLLRLSLGLQLGGALGNLLDRVRLGFVTDFIDIGPWPVFNLADAAIVTGLIIMGWVFTRGGGSKPDPAQPTAQPVEECVSLAQREELAGVCPVGGGAPATPPAPAHPASLEAMAEPAPDAPVPPGLEPGLPGGGREAPP